MSKTRHSRARSQIDAGLDAVAVADGYLVDEATSHYRWRRRGLLGRLVRTPIAQEALQARPSLRRAA
jgi:hypothetical protein